MPSFELHLGDCLEIVPNLNLNPKTTAVITDPPYGGKFDTDYRKRLRGGKAPSNSFKAIEGDDKPFDPAPWLAYRKVVLFGYQFFANRLPVGTVLVWNKRRENQLNKYMGDCELAWQKGGKGVYLFNHHWLGFDRASERGQKTLHPTQKPVALFRWVIDRLKLKAGDTVLDPYAGSGTVGLACLEKGINYVGCECVEDYYNVAKTRLKSKASTLI